MIIRGCDHEGLMTGRLSTEPSMILKTYISNPNLNITVLTSKNCVDYVCEFVICLPETKGCQDPVRLLLLRHCVSARHNARWHLATFVSAAKLSTDNHDLRRESNEPRGKGSVKVR